MSFRQGFGGLLSALVAACAAGSTKVTSTATFPLPSKPAPVPTWNRASTIDWRSSGVAAAADVAAPSATADKATTNPMIVVQATRAAAATAGARGRTRHSSASVVCSGTAPGAARPSERRGSGKGEARRAAFKVDSLRSVERAVPQKLRSRSGTEGSGNPALRHLDLTIRLGTGQACTVVDLMKIAQRAAFCEVGAVAQS
mgnify:CR=1 FL=1